MKLSVCVVTGSHPAQLAAVLEPWRELAYELVVGADNRVHPDWLNQYKDLADVVLPLEFMFLERHLADVSNVCSGDWIMRVDSDEVPSKSLVASFPTLLSTDVQQWWIPRRWIHPDGSGWLAETPWWPDLQLRLVRNTPELSFAGTLHSSANPSRSRGFAEFPIYHLDCLLHSREERVVKAREYERQQADERRQADLPAEQAPASATRVAANAMYEPERWAELPPQPIPGVDRPAIDRVLAAVGEAALPRLEGCPLEELVGIGRDASIRLLDRDLRFMPGETRSLMVAVGNRSTERWYGSIESDGAVTTIGFRPSSSDQDVIRSPLDLSIDPGQEIVTHVGVKAPSDPGLFEAVLAVFGADGNKADGELFLTFSVAAPGATT